MHTVKLPSTVTDGQRAAVNETIGSYVEAPAVKAPESAMVRAILAAKAAAGEGAYLSLHNSGECILWPSEGASVNDDGRRAVGWWQVQTVWEAEELTKTGAVDEHASGLRLVKPTWLVKPTFA